MRTIDCITRKYGCLIEHFGLFDKEVGSLGRSNDKERKNFRWARCQRKAGCLCGPIDKRRKSR